MTTVRVVPQLPFIVGPSPAVGIVQNTFTQLQQNLTGYQQEFQGAISGLLASASDRVELAQPVLDFATPTPPQTTPVMPIEAPDLTDISLNPPSAPNLGITLPAPPAYSMPQAPSLDAVTVPDAPNFTVGVVPTRPPVDLSVQLPDAPMLPEYTLAQLESINVPTFTPPVLPTFDEQAPMFDAVAPNVALNFTEPVYESENFDDVLATIKRINTGGLGLAPGIEDQLFERARSREDRTAMKETEAAHDTFAGRGFVAPPGALQAELSNIRERNQLQANALQRDILIRVADVQIENMRFAVTQGLAAEEILTRIFLNAAQREFEAARFAVESLLSLYNTKVSIFNAVVSAYQTRAQVYQTILNGQLANLEVYRIQLDGERLKGELNQQKVQIYTALLQSVQSEVEIYRAQVQAAQTKVEAGRTAIEAYRADVQAFAETVGTERLKLDAYRTRVDAEVSKSQVNQARASVFSTLVQANQAAVNVWSEQARVEIARVGAASQSYGATIEGYRAGVQAQLGRVQAQSDVQRTVLQSTSVQNEAIRATNEAAIRIGEQRVQTNIARANASVRLYEVNLTRLQQQQDIRTRSLQAAGQYLATLTGGAMAAQNVSASLSASASDSSSLNRSESTSNSLSETISQN